MEFNQTKKNTKKSLRAAVTASISLAIVLGVNPMAAQARTEGSSINFGSISMSNRTAYLNFGGVVANSREPQKSYQWYKCAEKITFISMVPSPTVFEGALTVVNTAEVLTARLNDAGCVILAGKVDSSISITDFYNSNGTLKDASKPFLTAEALYTPPAEISQQPHKGLAEGAFLRTSVKPIPGLSKSGDEFVSTNPTFTDGAGSHEVTPVEYMWYACDEDVTEGFKLHEWSDGNFNISTTPLATCQRLFSAWEVTEGWSGTAVSGLTFNSASAPVYTNSPLTAYEPLLENDVPAVLNLDGKYIVKAVDAYPYFGWSNGQVVGAEEETNPEDPETPGEESGTGSENLADTGTATETQGFIALLALLMGLGLVLVSRRRQNN